MPYAWDEIRDSWLQDGAIAAEPAEIVDQFNRVERILGRPWLEAKLAPAPGVSAYGALVTLEVVRAGRLLRSVEDLENAEDLYKKLRGGKETIWAELQAAYLLRMNDNVTLKLEPAVSVGSRTRRPDFRVRMGDEPWTYVEVTRPDTSEDRKRVEAFAPTLFGVLNSVPGEYALEVFLRRQPTEAEVGDLEQEVRKPSSSPPMHLA
jgi:hypothetical protein